MSIKSEKVQKYITDLGTKTQKYLLIGTSRLSDAGDNSNTSSINLWKDSQITYRVGKSDAVGIVTNIPWRTSTVYTPWQSSAINSGSFYIHNKSNGIVYLCISDNSKNRKDLRGNIASTVAPSHSTGIQRYEDGYEWLALYKITPSLQRFISTNWMPVISLNDFEIDSSVSKYQQSLIFCGNTLGQTGNCGVYFKQNSEILSGETASAVYQKGDLYTTITNTTCGECFHLFEDDDNLVSVFYGGETASATITLKDKLDEIGEYISLNQLASTSPYYQLYQMAVNGPEDGALLSCFIDLSQFTENQLICTEQNPQVTILTASGSNAVIRLTTYVNSSGNYVVDGIELVNRGYGYYDADLSLSSSLFPNLDESLLLSAIELNFDKIDSIGIDPISTLECSRVSLDIRISVDQLVDNNITLPEEIDFYGFVDNPLLKKNDVLVPAGKTINKFQSSVQTNNTKIKINKVSGTAPSIGSAVNIVNQSTSNVMTNLTVVNQTDETGADIVLEVNGVDNGVLDNFDPNTNSIIIEGDNDYTVTEYTQIPPIVQYSGKVNLTKVIPSQRLKSSSGDLSKIIRINRIEAL